MTTPSEFLVNTDHNSEARLVRCDSGRILMLWRLDPGAGGDHTGVTGYIASRYSDDGGATWTATASAYSDASYDDRNLCVGVIPSGANEGRVVALFRRYDVSTGDTYDICSIHSDDEGVTWSSATSHAAPAEVPDFVPSPAPTMTGAPGLGFPMYGHSADNTDWRCFLWWTTDGVTFGTKAQTIASADSDAPYKLSESTYADIGDGKTLFACRNANTYTNLGVTFSIGESGTYSTPERATTVPAYWITAPQLHVIGDLVYLLTCDRRASEPNASNQDSCVWVYTSTPARLVADVTDWTLLDQITRPVPSDYVFYGYPSLVQTASGGILVVFTERTHSGATEDAWLYSFTMVPPPYSVTATLTPTGAQVCWSHDGGADGFVVERQVDGGSWTQVYP